MKSLSGSCDLFEDVEDVVDPVRTSRVFALLFPKPLGPSTSIGMSGSNLARPLMSFQI